MFGLHERPLAYQCIISKTYKSRYKRRQSKDKDSTVHKTEYRSRRNPIGTRHSLTTAKALDPYDLND